MRQRPKIKIHLDPIDYLIQGIGILGLLTLIILPVYYYDQLPDVIPSHYGANGKADGFSGKGIIWMLPILGLILYLGIHWLNKYPHIFNFPQKVTEENAERLYTIATKVTRFINAQIAIVFTYITYSTIQTSLGYQDGLSSNFTILFIVSNFLIVGFLLYQSTKK